VLISSYALLSVMELLRGRTARGGLFVQKTNAWTQHAPLRADWRSMNSIATLVLALVNWER
jgi:hypothetical protein